MSPRAPLPAALLGLAIAAAAVPAPGLASGEEGAGLFGVEAGAGYASATPRSASSKLLLNGGAVRAGLSYGITDALGVAAMGQIAWYEPRRPIISVEYEDETGAIVTGTAYGDEVRRTRLQELGLGLVYTLDVLRVVPYLSGGVASLRAVEEAGGGERVDYDAVLWLEVGVDLAVARRLRIGASAVFDVLLTGHTEFTGQTALLVSAVVLLGPAKVGPE